MLALLIWRSKDEAAAILNQYTILVIIEVVVKAANTREPGEDDYEEMIGLDWFFLIFVDNIIRR